MPKQTLGKDVMHASTTAPKDAPRENNRVAPELRVALRECPHVIKLRQCSEDPDRQNVNVYLDPDATYMLGTTSLPDGWEMHVVSPSKNRLVVAVRER